MKKSVWICVLLCAVVLSLVSCSPIDRSAEVMGEGGFIIQGEKYISLPIGFTEEGKVIAKADSYNIMMIPEDTDRNFLAVRSFTDNWTIVKESYVIPTQGDLNVAYLDHERITEGKKWEMTEYILAGEFAGSFIVQTNAMGELPSATDSLYVGYGDCPVGTHWLGRVGNINGKLVFVKADDMKDDDLIYTCYVLEDEYQDLMKDSVKNNFEIVNK